MEHNAIILLFWFIYSDKAALPEEAPWAAQEVMLP